MKRDKPTLITIIVLLIIFLPISVLATFKHMKNPNAVIDPNVNHEFKYNNKLYYYNKDNSELYGTYECTTENCGAIKTIIDDDKYSLDYYKDGKLEELNYYDNEFAYLQDESISIYSFTTNKTITTFEDFKNYNTNLKNDVIIAKKNGKWGVLSLSAKSVTIPYEYDFLGLINNVKDDVLDTSLFVGLKDDKWYLVDVNNNVKSTALNSEIKTFTDLYIVDKDNIIYDYEGNEITPNITFKNIYAIDKYLIGVTDNNTVMVYHDLTQNFLGYANIGQYFKLSFKLGDNTITIYDNKEEKQSIAIN